MQICFAFIFGIVFALVFITCHSIWPCIALHAFHDFCSFISAGGSELGNIVVGGSSICNSALLRACDFEEKANKTERYKCLKGGAIMYRIFLVEDDQSIAGAVAKHLDSWG